ncbi:AAA family ATPase [Undibacterium amnicola]|uniref:AAA family ATPase n=2 Tax=Undibacterium amnicola TaxID=1834038 RepID=A0ABR6XVX9_9BURK|nr:AAA family ATPase [Undibacterium amnicola]
MEIPPLDATKSHSKHSVFKEVESKLTLNSDVILADETRLQLDECMAKLRHHKTIYLDWGFAAVDPLGMSTILNFYGPPGTGKTLAAQALAGTLSLPIIQIGIAEIESKMMGDSSKNIQAAFQSARLAGAILFFDEADTLLGKRLSSVTQGVDNEVNAMRSTLLIELERFDGIVIFATNFAKNYDEAFRSRIGHHIHFALPDLNARTLLWDRMLVPNIPLAQDRKTLISLCAEMSEGFSGREIRTCMRLALPKVLLESERLTSPANLTSEHILSAISQIRTAHTEVAVNATAKRERPLDIAAAKNLLGISL